MVKTLDEVFDHPYELVAEPPGVAMVVKVVSLQVVVTSPLENGLGGLVADSGQSVVSLSSVQVVPYVAVTLDVGYGADVETLGVGVPDSATGLEDDVGLDAAEILEPPEDALTLNVVRPLPGAMAVPELVGTAPLLRPEVGNSLKVEFM
jgi:hypothetical protein